jgi:DNA-binding MarR family transcriptional regulator
VERRSDPRDARASLVFLTPRSRAFEPVAEDVLRELHEDVRTRLGPERADELRQALSELLPTGWQ